MNDRHFMIRMAIVLLAAAALSIMPVVPAWAQQVEPVAASASIAHELPPDAPAASPYFSSFLSPPAASPATSPAISPTAFGNEPWTWQLLPTGIMYRSYLAGTREPRLAAQWLYTKGKGWLWEAALGGKAGVIRYGTQNEANPEGFQFDLEGVALPRLDWNTREVITNDYHFGFPFTFHKGPWEAKIGYYHYCSHYSDQYILKWYPDADRVDYTRDSVVLGIGWHPWPAVRLYGEVDWAFHTTGSPLPWQFQVGAEYSSLEPDSIYGSPFFAVNGRLRQDVNFGGSFVAEAGWQWRGQSGHLLRMGVMYTNGMSDQGQLNQTFEEQLGLGLWYDF